MFKPYAKFAINSKGRLHKDSDSNRNVFQRDKDRIIHSASFRRLEYKTQVFVNSLGDHFRTRLTHSLEVAQIAREISTRLGVNSDLSEVVALSHDIGHPPFGHAGCDILDELMQDFGGFDHNQFVLKLLTEIEEKYINFKGLNLTYESLEGIIKHNGPILDAKGYLQQFNYEFNLDLHLYPSLEAQIASLSDDIAYNNHDIDDGFRAGILKIEDFKDSELLYEAFSQIKFLSPNAPRSVFIHESLRKVYSKMINDLVSNTQKNIANNNIRTCDDIHNHKEFLASFSSKMLSEIMIVKKILQKQLYNNEIVVQMCENAKKSITELFNHYKLNPDSFFKENDKLPNNLTEVEYMNKLCDYIAGMTDRFVMKQVKKITD